MTTVNDSDIPVLLIIFNRPEKVRALIKALSAVQPRNLYIAADGPRDGNISDAHKCLQAREAALDIDWPCSVHTLFSEDNLGVDPAVEHGIEWFFSQVERGIILEDDCIPHPDFFRFVRTMLERYQSDEQAMLITGNNFQGGRKRGDGDYYFSVYPTTWGWATWKRAWKQYDSRLSSFPAFDHSRRIERLLPRSEQRYWRRYFRSLFEGKRRAWDAKWIFAIWNASGYCITPNVNLIQNIGFGPDATHTSSSEEESSSIPARPLSNPIHHPQTLHIDDAADRYLFEVRFRVTLLKRLRYAVYLLRKSADSIGIRSIN